MQIFLVIGALDMSIAVFHFFNIRTLCVSVYFWTSQLLTRAINWEEEVRHFYSPSQFKRKAVSRNIC